MDLLYAFNSGNISKFDELKKSWSGQVRWKSLWVSLPCVPCRLCHCFLPVARLISLALFCSSPCPLLLQQWGATDAEAVKSSVFKSWRWSECRFCRVCVETVFKAWRWSEWRFGHVCVETVLKPGGGRNGGLVTSV